MYNALCQTYIVYNIGWATQKKPIKLLYIYSNFQETEHCQKICEKKNCGFSYAIKDTKYRSKRNCMDMYIYCMSKK